MFLKLKITRSNFALEDIQSSVKTKLKVTLENGFQQYFQPLQQCWKA
jgi:hypothetical protein